jgi:hypothetical protein
MAKPPLRSECDTPKKAGKREGSSFFEKRTKKFYLLRALPYWPI